MVSIMKKIRASFETNSSSAHTLVISDNEISNTINDLGYFSFNQDKKIFHVSGGETEFGWEWLTYSYPPTKANYLYLDGDKERLTNIILEQTSADEVVFQDINEANYPYIDHQSQGCSTPIFNLSDEEVWHFLMNDSVIRTGNDNSSGPWDIYTDDFAD